MVNFFNLENNASLQAYRQGVTEGRNEQHNRVNELVRQKFNPPAATEQSGWFSSIASSAAGFTKGCASTVGWMLTDGASYITKDSKPRVAKCLNEMRKGCFIQRYQWIQQLKGFAQSAPTAEQLERLLLEDLDHALWETGMGQDKTIGFRELHQRLITKTSHKVVRRRQNILTKTIDILAYYPEKVQNHLCPLKSDEEILKHNPLQALRTLKKALEENPNTADWTEVEKLFTDDARTAIEEIRNAENPADKIAGVVRMINKIETAAELNQHEIEMLTHDIEEVISYSPLLTLYTLKDALKKDPETADWRQVENLVTNEAHTAFVDIRDAGSPEEKIAGVNRMINETLKSILMMAHGFAERNKEEMRNAINGAENNETRAFNDLAPKEALFVAVRKCLEKSTEQTDRARKDLYYQLCDQQDQAQLDLLNGISTSELAPEASAIINDFIKHLEKQTNGTDKVVKVALQEIMTTSGPSDEQQLNKLIDDKRLKGKEKEEEVERLEELKDSAERDSNVNISETVKAAANLDVKKAAESVVSGATNVAREFISEKLKERKEEAKKQAKVDAINDVLKSGDQDLSDKCGNIRNIKEAVGRGEAPAQADIDSLPQGVKEKIEDIAAAEESGVKPNLFDAGRDVLNGNVPKESLKEAVKAFGKESMPWVRKELKKKIEQMKASIDADSLRPNISAYEEKLNGEANLREDLKTSLEGVKGVLEANNREDAIQQLLTLSNGIMLKADYESKKDELMLVKDLVTIVQKDNSGAVIHMLEALESIANNNGEKISEDLVNMLKVMADNEGRDFLLEKIDCLKGLAEKQAKAAALDHALINSKEDLTAFNAQISTIKTAFSNGVAPARDQIDALPEKIRLVVDEIANNKQGEIQVSLLDIFKATLEGTDPKEPLVKAFESLKEESDRIFFEEIADTLEKGGERGLEDFIDKYLQESSDEAKGAIPFHLKRIFSYLISKEGQKAVGNVAAHKIMKGIMGEKITFGPDGNFDQKKFNSKVDEFLEKYLLPGDSQVAGVEKSDLFDVVKALSTWATEGGGLPRVAIAYLKRYAELVNGDRVPPTRDQLLQKQSELDEELGRIGDGPMEIAPLIRDLLIQKIETETSQEWNENTVKIDVGDFVINNGGGSEGELIHFAKLGNLAIGMNKDAFKLILDVSIKRSLIEGKHILSKASEGQTGYDFICDMAGEACQAMKMQLNNPGGEIKWNDEKASLEIAKKLFGENGEKLGLTPFVEKMVMEIVAPDVAGSIPFKILGVKAFGPQIIEHVYKGDLYKTIFDDVLANRMQEKLREIQKEGNIYDFFFKFRFSKKKKLVLSEQEKKLKKHLGELVLAFCDNTDLGLNRWTDELKAFQLDGLLTENIGEVMIPILRDFLEEEMGKEAHTQITSDDLYNYVMKKSSQGIKLIAEGKLPNEEEKALNQEKAQETLGEIGHFIAPLMENRSVASLVIGCVHHFIFKFIIKPVVWLISTALKAWCKKFNKNYEKTIWYMLTEGQRKLSVKRRGRALYKPVREIMQNDLLWQRMWDRIIGQRIIGAPLTKS